MRLPAWREMNSYFELTAAKEKAERDFWCYSTSTEISNENEVRLRCISNSTKIQQELMMNLFISLLEELKNAVFSQREKDKPS